MSDTRQNSWLRHCAASYKVADSVLDEVTRFVQFTWTFQKHYGPRVDRQSSSRKADSLITVYEPIV
jgi:hypothetical protein